MEALTKIKVQRLSRKGVHSSEWKQAAPEMGEDIVYPIWRHIEVHKRTGQELATLVEYKSLEIILAIRNKYSYWYGKLYAQELLLLWVEHGGRNFNIGLSLLLVIIIEKDFELLEYP